MSRLIVHIGTHKTATTTLQRHMARNRDALAARGIWYPDYSNIGKGSHYAHLGIVNALSEQHDKFSVEDATRFFADVVARAPDHDVTILSAEPFYRHIAYPEGGGIPRDPDRYWRLRHDYIARVRELFGAADPEIVVVFRRQVDYAPSLYQEHVKTTRYIRDFATWRREFWYHFDYLGQARAWAEAFGGISPLRFEDLVGGGDPVARFGAHLGLDLSGPEQVKQQNVSMHPDAVVLKRLLNRTKIDKDILREDVEAAMDGAIRSRLRRFRNRSLFRDADDLRDFHREFLRDNDTLRRDFFAAGMPAPLFDDTLNLEQRFGDELNPYFLNIMVGGLAAPNAPEIEDTQTE